MQKVKRNRIAVNLEDEIHEAFVNLAERENVSSSELARDMIVSELARMGLLPEATIRRLVGVRG